FLLQLTDDRDAEAAWKQLPKLEGITRLRPARRGLDSVLAETPDHDPVLVAQAYGKGRVLAFAGDSTWRWVRSPKLQEMHGRGGRVPHRGPRRGQGPGQQRGGVGRGVGPLPGLRGRRGDVSAGGRPRLPEEVGGGRRRPVPPRRGPAALPGAAAHRGAGPQP